MLAGYYFVSLLNNIGIVYWFVVIFIVCLIVKLHFYIFETKVKLLPKSSKLLKYVYLGKNLTESAYNYLSVNQIISITSLTLYLWYEYIETRCFDVYCILSDKTISGTQLVKFDLILTVILIIGLLIHFFRILVLVYWKNWFGFQSELDLSRVKYVKEHARLMCSGFGRAHDF